jgi:S-formylglutathione hydrolase FrmB
LEQPAFAEQLKRVYGPPASKMRKDNDIFILIKHSSPDAIPYLYLDCGTADDFLATNREFVAGLPARHFRYEYQERPGKHDWTFWDHSIQILLRDVIPQFAH